MRGGGRGQSFKLKGSGDFQSEECIELLKQVDIVVTNPPFSLFRKYFAQLMEHKKNFIILGRLTAFKNKDAFPLFQRNEVWVGANGGSFTFDVPAYEKDGVTRKEGETEIRQFGNILWYTNLDYKKRHEDVDLYRWYDESEYSKYDNYDAIEVGEVVEIPQDYTGVMGVPISMIMKLNPAQFELVSKASRDKHHPLKTKVYTADHTPQYNDLNASAVVVDENGEFKPKFERLFVRNLKPRHRA